MLRLAHPEMAWGLLLVAAPLVIHLINRLRKQRIEWAAMEFLIESQRKHRTSVRLRELLLLLARMAAVAGIVLLLARPTWRPEWAATLGGSRSHQIVLVDDSFSMTDRGATQSTFDRAREALGRLGVSLARERRGAALTLALASSRARDGGPWRPLLTRDPIGESTGEKLAELSLGVVPGQSAVAPTDVLEAAGALIGGEDEHTEIWLLTDCRQRNWSGDPQLDAALTALESRTAQVHVVDCAERPRPNAAITALDIPSGVRVAGVPLRVEVEVANFSDEPLENLIVEANRGESWQPAVTFPQVAARQRARQAFHWVFPEPGTHILKVRAPADAVAADNERFAVVEAVEESPVLIIDDDPRSEAGRFLALALAPGGRSRTGLAPRIEPSSFLATQSLEPFSAIYLANLQRLDAAQRDALTEYMNAGGGLGLFVGPETDAPAVTDELYRGGAGWLPLPLSDVRELAGSEVDGEIDLQPDDPELFRIFAGQRNSFLHSVRIDRFYAPPEGWAPRDRATRVLARVRGGQPLVIERRQGRGRVVAFLTTAAPLWNDWGRNPSFVVILLELHARLAAGRVTAQNLLVGQPLEVTRRDTAAGAVRFTPPGDQASPLDVVAKPSPAGLAAVLPEAEAAGIYRATWKTPGPGDEGRGAEELLAVNVDPAEGDIKRADLSELRERLRGRAIDFAPALGWRLDADLAGWQSTQWLVLALLGLLAGEQWLAWRAGYHPAPGGGKR